MQTMDFVSRTERFRCDSRSGPKPVDKENVMSHKPKPKVTVAHSFKHLLELMGGEGAINNDRTKLKRVEGRVVEAQDGRAVRAGNSKTQST